MKKTALFLVFVLVFSLITMSSCDIFGKKECTEHVDADGNYICDNCEAELEKPDPKPEPPVCEEHKDEDGDEKCDVCGADVPAPKPPVCEDHVDANEDYVCDNCGAELEKPQPPACTEHADNDSDHYCDGCGKQLTEEVKYSLNISDLTAGVRSEDDINGKFTIVSGTEVRNRTKTYQGIEYNKSIKIGGNAHMIKVSVPGNGTLRFIIQNGSSGVDMQFTKVIAPDGTVHDIEFVAGAESNPLVMIEIEVTEGEWTIGRGKNGGTQDIFYLELDCVVAIAEENGFELVDEGKNEFLVGEALDVSGVRLNATFANGKTDTLDPASVQFDTSAVDMSVSGTYPVTITYKDYEPITYYVDVYAPESIKLGFDAIEKLAQNSAAGNGVYYNHSFKEVYVINEEFDASGLSVIVVAKCGDKTLEFLINDYTVSGFDSSFEDFNKITISTNGLEIEVTVHIASTEPTPNEKGVYQLLVDSEYYGIAGALSGPYHVFQTIQGALDYAEHIDKSAVKEIYVAPGYYNEKLEITIPNLKLIGWGEKPEDVVIEWNSLYGLPDAGGFVHVTDSTATVSIRDAAVNCEISNLTISNYWNTQERMNEAGLAIERGLALLVQTDRFVMKNGRLLGIQDTLELFTGRQYFENVFISGYTDFIFGTNNTTLFKNCTIHVIDTEKDDKGTAGYITAFKGSNKGASDSIVYGVIFDGCKFTADEGVTEGCTAIGRPWGAYAAVAVINSELGGHISVKGFTGGKNERYVSMNAKPTDATVQYLEYNNTGAGALTEAVAGMRFLTAEEAALYVDVATIFGTANGQVSYLDAWDPFASEVVKDDRTYYYFNGTEGSEGTSYTYTDNIQGATGTFGDMTIDATKGKVTARGSDTQINAGAKLIFNVEAGTLVTVISYPGYGNYTINGKAHNANDTFSVYFAEATEVVIEATATAYLYQVIVNPNEEAPEKATLSQIKVEGMNTNYTVGDELSLEGAVVKAYYSDNSIVTVADYTVDASAVVNTAAGTYDVVFSFGGVTFTVAVVYEGADADPAITENLLLDFTTQDGLNAIKGNNRITIEEVAGQFYFNNGNSRFEGTISFMVKAGAKIIITPYHDPKYVSYTIGYLGEEELMTYTGSYTYEVDSDCTMVYTGLSGNHICSIQIVYPVEVVKENFTVTFGSEGNYKNAPAVVDLSNVQIGDNGGDNSQVKNGYITVKLLAGATLTINGYSGYTSYTIGDGTTTTEEITDSEYVYTASADVVVTITPVSGNNYFYSFSVSYPVEVVKESFTVTFGSEGNYSNAPAVVDLSKIQIGDNGGDNSQVKNGYITVKLLAGATLTINGYSGYTSYTIGDGTTTTEEITDSEYVYTASADVVVTITPVSGNNYFYSIDVKY